MKKNASPVKRRVKKPKKKDSETSSDDARYAVQWLAKQGREAKSPKEPDKKGPARPKRPKS